MKAITSLLMFIVLVTLSGKSQTTLTHALSEDEKARFHTIGKDFYTTDPPTGEVRNIAEFEPSEGVLVRYPFGIPMTLIAAISESDMVTTIVANQSQEDQVRSLYSQNGVNLSNCDFLHAPSDSYWTRDYAPWFIMIDNAEVAAINFPYNRPRINDNDIPIHVASHLGIDLYGMNLIHTGGNWMADGYYQGAHTDLVLEENPTLSQNDVDQLVEDYLGITTNHIVDDPLGDYIKHIDCWGKFLGPDKIIIGQVPQTDSRYQDFEDAASYWQNATSSYGTPYRVFRVYTPGGTPATPYSNSYIINKKVFVPQSGSQWDDEALEAYAEAMPGYEIHGIYHTTWENTDALHCRTHEIADRQMLYIDHIPLLGIQPAQDAYTITADIYALSGEEIYADSVLLRYRINGGLWEEEIMTTTDFVTYTSGIDYPGEGFEMMYYIHAADESGRSENHPYIGKWEPHTFYVPAPGAPTCISPENNSSAASVFADLLWQDGGTYPASSFRISMGTDNPPTNIIHNIITEETEYTPIEKLDYNATYFWQVTAVNDYGEYTGDVWSFTTMGEPDEDFETGDFSLFDWTFDGDSEWSISESEKRDGIYAARSGDINDNETSEMFLTINCSGFGKIIWWGKTDCEENDYLHFYIDDVEVASLSGDSEWQEFRSSTGPGPHTFRWSYTKDEQNSSGEDCAWIDFIYLPQHENVLSADAGDDGETCADLPFTLNGMASGYTSVEWTTSGDGAFADTTVLSTMYTPGAQDAENGIVTLTLAASDGSGNQSTDEMLLTIHPLPVIPDLPLGPDTVYVYMTSVTTYSTSSNAENSAWIWDITPGVGSLTSDLNTCQIEWDIDVPVDAELRVKGENSCGESQWSEVKIIHLVPDVVPGYSEERLFVADVYPNPSSGDITISIKNNVGNILSLTLLDSYGRTVFQKNDDSCFININISNLLQGIYVLQVRHEDRMYAYKVVIR